MYMYISISIWVNSTSLTWPCCNLHRKQLGKTTHWTSKAFATVILLSISKPPYSTRRVHAPTPNTQILPVLRDLRFFLQKISPRNRRRAVKTSPDHRPAGNSQEHPGRGSRRHEEGTGQYIFPYRGPLVCLWVSMPANVIPLTNGTYSQNTMAVKTSGTNSDLRYTLQWALTRVKSFWVGRLVESFRKGTPQESP